MRVATLDWHLPQMLQSAEQAAAPQQEAAKEPMVVMDGITMRGRERRAPIVAVCGVVRSSGGVNEEVRAVVGGWREMVKTWRAREVGRAPAR